jgi:hypothetical protein
MSMLYLLWQVLYPKSYFNFVLDQQNANKWMNEYMTHHKYWAQRQLHNKCSSPVQLHIPAICVIIMTDIDCFSDMSVSMVTQMADICKVTRMTYNAP